jgi:single-stranded-DNA-specific exonuclease
VDPWCSPPWHPDDVIEPRFRWTFPDLVPTTPSTSRLATEPPISDRLARLLAARGAVTHEDLVSWFAEPMDGLHDPARLPDAGRLLERLSRARDRGERVLVFGDFDADGLTGLAIMTLALRRFGVAVEPYVPSRLDEGHGLSLAAIDAAIAGGSSVIVTVDCGSTSVAEVAVANERGVDVIITDHHRVPSVTPAAYALVNPHRPDSTYPDRRLAGSGVAFKVAQLLLADLPGGPAAALDLTDLATIGSVADVAPVVGENRSIARLGLERLRRAPRPGIAALLERARIAPAAVDLETVSFAIAPRLNAAGRVGEALEAARLLLADDLAEAGVHADALEAANLTRRDLMKSAVAEARATVADAAGTDGATVVRGPWSVGIVGLVAARLVEDRGRPAVVGADLGDVVRASCRSDGSLDLGAALDRCDDLFIRHGGHAGAAGFEIATDRWDEFRTRFLGLAAASAPADARLTLTIDLALPARDVDYALFREFGGLAPCGPGNPDPLVAVLGLTVTRVRAATGGHSQLTLRRERDVLDGIAFGRADIAETVHEGDRVDVVARLTSRVYGGFESLQLDIRDVATSGSHPGSAAILAERDRPSLPVLAGSAS